MANGLRNNNQWTYLDGILLVITLFPTLSCAVEIDGRLSQAGAVMQGTQK
ncbi:MAG: hypothetical protein WBO73_16120 [Gammaproteobacteria bacterium]|jgi:hypothetical protein